MKQIKEDTIETRSNEKIINFVEIYKNADSEKRFQILIDNYATIPKEIRKAEKKLQFKIKAEKEWARGHKAEELGVRVNTSTLGDPTADEAINNVMMEQAFETGNLDTSLLKGIADTFEYEEEFRLIRIMKMDYELLVELIEGLADNDARIMKERFAEGKLIKEIAEDERKTFDAIRRRIDKLCNEIKEEILEYLEMSSGRLWKK